jgi:hypothetical protein
MKLSVPSGFQASDKLISNEREFYKIGDKLIHRSKTPLAVRLVDVAQFMTGHFNVQFGTNLDKLLWIINTIKTRKLILDSLVGDDVVADFGKQLDSRRFYYQAGSFGSCTDESTMPVEQWTGLVHFFIHSNDEINKDQHMVELHVVDNLRWWPRSTYGKSHHTRLDESVFHDATGYYHFNFNSMSQLTYNPSCFQPAMSKFEQDSLRRNLGT